MPVSNFSPELQKVLRRKTPPSKDILKLIKTYKKYRKGRRKEEIREEILTINAKLVANIAQKQALHCKTPVEDLFQEGMEGLAIALDKFSYRRGILFSTYATWWIKRNMQRIKFQETPVVVLGHGRDNLKKLMNKGKGSIDFSDMNEEKKRALDATSALAVDRYVYLDKDFHNDSGDIVKFEVEDKKSNVEKEVYGNLQREEIIEATNKILSEKERYVIHNLFLRPDPWLKSKIARELGYKSQESIRHMETKALVKLRHYFQSKKSKEIIF